MNDINIGLLNINKAGLTAQCKCSALSGCWKYELQFGKYCILCCLVASDRCEQVWTLFIVIWRWNAHVFTVIVISVNALQIFN